MKRKNKNNDYLFYIIFNKRKIVNKILFYILIFLCLNYVFCSEDNSKNNTKTMTILILSIVAVVVIIVLIIIFIICICCKKKQTNVNNYLEGSIAFERGNQEEVELRERITNEGVHALSEYLKDKLIYFQILNYYLIFYSYNINYRCI